MGCIWYPYTYLLGGLQRISKGTIPKNNKITFLATFTTMKEKKPKKDKPKQTTQVVTGSFLDIMKASVKHADTKAVKKKS